MSKPRIGITRKGGTLWKTQETNHARYRARVEECGGYPVDLSPAADLLNPFSKREFRAYFSLVVGRLCRAAVAGTASHLKSARFEHLGQSLGESLPTLRAQLATMQIDTDGLSSRIDDLIDHLEKPRETTMLRVLESKAAAGDVAISVTSAAMRICGGAAFSKHLSIERLFRDAHAGAVMAPTGDVLREFIGKSLLGMPLF
jgi:alkylation response protein AidB-like acyl-CoA dehydrogenase